MMKGPYLSIVTCARNDNHGGDLLPRIQSFVDCLRAGAAQLRLPIELVLVEWNPPGNRKRLPAALDLSAGAYCAIRVLEVPARLHDRLRYSGHLHLFQMIAKNCGIRRACGEFICSTNVDIIFPDRLLSLLMPGKLSGGILYRTDRHDVKKCAAMAPTVAGKLAYCSDNVIRINAWDRTEDLVRKAVHRTYTAGRDFPPPLHTNACGDFQLMHRDNWFALQGYAEWEIFSLHIDSMLEYCAYYAGIREKILDVPVYHVEHDAGWKPKVDAQYKRRFSGIRTLTFEEVLMMARKMRADNAPLLLNGPSWGLVDIALREWGGA